MARLLVVLSLLGATLLAEDHVLLVGCTEYPNLRGQRGYKAFIRLLGPENDVDMVREALVDAMGIGKDRITVLSGWNEKTPAANPTRANILAQFDRLAQVSKSGDRVIVLMAGHGSQQPDRSGEEPDGMDEIFLPCDVKGWNGKKGEVENSIPDDLIAQKVRAIRDAGAAVWLLMDCCHAGSMVRKPDALVRSRQLAPSILGVPPADGTRRAHDKSPLEDLTGVAAMYASPSFRTAPEMRLPRGADDAEWHGLFSYTLVQQLRRTGGNLTFRQLHAQMIASYQALPYRGTLPVAEGDLDRTLAGAADGRPPLWVRLENDRFTLNAGRIAGVTPGTKVKVVRMTGEALGEFEVTAAEMTRSICRAPKGITVPKDDILPATIVATPLGDLRLKLFYEGKVGNEIQFLFEENRFHRVDSKRAADFVLRAAEDGSFRLHPSQSGTDVEFRVEAGRLLHALRRIHRVENLKRFGASGKLGALPSDLRIELRKIKGGKTIPVGPGGLLHPGDEVALYIQNNTGEAWDLTLLVLDSHYGINELFPSTDSPRLDADATGERRIGPFVITDETQGIEHLLALAIPAGKREPVSLGWLAHEQLTTRGAGTGEVEKFFSELAFGTQRAGGLVARPAAAAAMLLTWQTGYGVVAPPAKFPDKSTVCIEPRHTFEISRGPAPANWKPACAEQRARGSLAMLYGKIAPSIVVVRTRNGHGTGFVVGKGGLVLTNAHVVASGYETSKRGRPGVFIHRGSLTEDGAMEVGELPSKAEVILVDERLDLALLSAPGVKDLPGIPFAPKGPKPGDECVLIGHPSSGLLWSMREGRIAGIGRMPHDMVNALVARLAATGPAAEVVRTQLGKLKPVKIVLSDCAANPGDSGSPLVDLEGRLVAITYAIPSKVRDDKFVYHVHLDVIREFIKAKRPDGPIVPDGWRLGPRVVLSKTDPAGSPDVLVAGTEKPEQMLIDVDGDTKIDAAALADLASFVRNRAFDAEIALHFASDRRTAFYDTDNDGAFDLILVDEDQDPEAEVRFTKTASGWTVETGIAVNWLSADHLAFEGGKDKAVGKLRTLKIQ